MSRRAEGGAAVFAFIVFACGAPAPPPATAIAPKPAADGPATPADYESLCEALAERARRCPGPPPTPVASCTATAACAGSVVRPEVIRGLIACQSHKDCSRQCTMKRVAESLPATATNIALDKACVARRDLCPLLDCNALVRDVHALDAEWTTPLIDCLKLEDSCLVEKMSTPLAKVKACGPIDPAK